MLPAQTPRETTPPTLRSYQLQVLQRAVAERVIACLPTGAGKTLIALELLRARLERLRERTAQFDPETAKICVFVAPTKALVTQQAAYLGAGLNAQVRFVTGESRSPDGLLVDSWEAEQWAQEIGTCDVLVMTPELLRRALQHSLIPLHALDCVVLDEVHHAHKNNPMAVICQLMNDGFERTGYRPHMLGLTASPVQNKKNPKQAFDQLQATTDCRILVPPEDLLRDLEEHVPKAALKLLYHETKLVYGGIETKDMFSDLNNMFQLVGRSGAHMSLLSTVPNVLLHAYLRLREADELADVRRTFRTAGIADPFPVMATSNGHHGDNDDDDDGRPTITHRFVPFLSQAKRLVGALVRIAHECGVLCALHALLTALRGDEEDDEEGSLLFNLTWMSPGEDLRVIGTVDVDQKEKVLETLQHGPHGRELAQLVDHAAVLHISLTEATIALLSVLTPSMCTALLDRLADATAADHRGLTEAHRRTWTYRVIEAVLQQLAQYNDVSFACSFDGIARAAEEAWGISREDDDGERLDRALFEVTGDVIRRVCRIALDVLYAQPEVVNEMAPAQSGDADALLYDLPVNPPSAQSGATATNSPSSQRRAIHHDPTFRFVSPKLKACWQFLRAYSAQRFAQSGEPWAAIVFCEMRLEADALRKWFRRACEQVREASIRPGAFVGDSASDALIPKSLTRHQEVLQQFRRGVTNVLFCTNVAEEGLDTPICQLVVNFDLPPTVKAFIQRRGRARARDSLFVACVNECSQTVQEAQLRDFRKKDAEMNNQLDELLQAVAQLPESQRGSEAFAAVDEDSPVEVADAGELADTYVVPSTGARCDLTSSINLLNQYCQLLPHDTWTSTQPQYTICGTDGAFACELTLPFAAPPQARHVAVSGASSKNAARQWAALLCVQRLHEAGELDNRLVPTDLESVTETSGSRSQQQQQQANQNEDVTVQTKMLPDVLRLPGDEGSVSELQPLWYYSIDFQAATQPDAAILYACPNCSLYAKALQRVGFVTMQPLPDELIEWAFDSSFHRGNHRHPPMQVRLRLVPHGSRPASSENVLVQLYQQFHELLKACCVSNAAEPFWWHREWVPFERGCGFSWLPFPAEMQPADFFALDEHAQAAFTQETITSIEAMLRAMQGATPPREPGQTDGTVRQSASHLLHKVVKTTTGQRLCYVVLSHAVSPSGDEEEPHSHIDADTVEVVPAHIKSSLFTLNRKVQASTNGDSPSKRAKRNRLLPVNECQIVGDATWLYAARIMPSFTFLMQSQLLAIELNAHLQAVLPEEHHRFIPPLPALLEAITPLRAHDAQDSERLEWLGDSALKFAVSVHMFAAHPDRNEMVLDRKRAALISNEHLARVAVDLDIAKYIRLLDLTSTISQVDGTATVTVKGKAVSDCVEAIIGAFARAGGEDAVWAIVAAVVGTTRPTAFDNQEEATRGREVARSSEQLAQRLGGYEFRNSRLLGAALTHPSCQTIANYQRLEYLGDAVLDYIVALRLFDALPTADPGVLSDTKSRLVRNEALAPLAVRMELPRHVHVMNDALRAVLRSCQGIDEGDAFVDEAPISSCLKVLADLVEAIIGAVYVDSDGDLEAVRRVVDSFGVLSSLA